PTPSNSQTPLSGAPGVEEQRIRYEERAAILEYDEGLPRVEAERRAAAETGYRLVEPQDAISPAIAPDLPQAAARSPAAIEVYPEDVTKILRDTETDLKAIRELGSREAANEAGLMSARSASRLPWQKLRQSPEDLMEFMVNAASTLATQMDAIKGGDILNDAKVTAKVREMADYYGDDPATIIGE